MWHLFLLQLVSSLECSQFECRASNIKMHPEQCVSYTAPVYSLYPCESYNYVYCPSVAQAQDEYCKLPIAPTTYLVSAPGEPCSFDMNCVSGFCVRGLCVGFAENTSCSNDLQCNPGHYCEGVCKPQKPLGSKGCNSDESCSNTSACNQSECIAYFSLKEGSVVDTCDGNSSILCESATCMLVGGKFKCTKSLKLKNKVAGEPLKCNSDKDCETEEDASVKQSFDTLCSCGYNGSGSSFCAPAPGDEDAKEYFMWLQKWIASPTIKVCHTSRRFNESCMKNKWDDKNYVAFMYYQTKYLRYSEIQQNDQCVKSVYTADYWNLFEEHNRMNSYS